MQPNLVVCGMLRGMRNTIVSVEYQNWNGDAPEKEKKNPCWSLPSSSLFEFSLSFQCLLQPSAIVLHRTLILSSMSVPSTQGTVMVRISHSVTATAVQTYHFFLLLQKAGQRERGGLCMLANTIITGCYDQSHSL